MITGTPSSAHDTGHPLLNAITAAVVPRDWIWLPPYSDQIAIRAAQQPYNELALR